MALRRESPSRLRLLFENDLSGKPVAVSKDFLQAIKSGPNNKVAVTYFEWSASSDRKIIIPWRIIDGRNRRMPLPTKS
jgi:hypothetical protein